MKKVLIAFLGVLFLLISCGNQEGDDNPADYREAVVVLSAPDVEKLIAVLPQLMAFSVNYQKKISPAEANDSTNFIRNFYTAIRKDKKIKEAAQKQGFDSIERFIQVYANVNYAYMILRDNLPDYSNQIILLQQDIANERKAVEEAMLSTPANEQEPIKQQLEVVEYKEMVLSNIMLVKNYQFRIQEIENYFNQFQ